MNYGIFYLHSNNWLTLQVLTATFCPSQWQNTHFHKLTIFFLQELQTMYRFGKFPFHFYYFLKHFGTSIQYTQSTLTSHTIINDAWRVNWVSDRGYYQSNVCKTSKLNLKMIFSKCIFKYFTAHTKKKQLTDKMSCKTYKQLYFKIKIKKM